MNTRIHEVRRLLEAMECDAWLSLDAADNQYLSGVLAGSVDFLEPPAAVIVTADDALYLCDSRYTEAAERQTRGLTVELIKGNLPLNAARRLNSLGTRRIAIDPAHVTLADAVKLKDAVEGELMPAEGFLQAMRATKGPEEIELIRAASRLAEDVLDELLMTLGEGDSEQELAARFEYEFKRRGAAGAAFDTIVLFGARSSLPHGEPGAEMLGHGDIVLLDLGCRRQGYCSDLTRTYVFGTIPGDWFSKVYETTRAAQQAALDAVRPGVGCRELDAIARDIITQAGYGEYFGHGLGHGVGIQIHESPRLNTESQAILEAGMVITVEPGIYLPGQGGVRIEDLVVVTEDGCEVLTSTPKELKVLQL